MSTLLGNAYVRIRPDLAGFQQEANRSVSSALKSAAKIAAVAAGAALGTVGLKFLKDSIGEASALNESINAVNVTFGKSAKGILGLGENAAKALGLSKNEFNGLSVRFSEFAKTVAGRGGDVVGTMEDLTGRAADFASVMNLDVNDAAELFQSGLAGETEPLRKYGIDLSAAAVTAYAYANGIGKVGTELTESQKVQARYGLLMKSTAKTQGDFANTSDGLANKQRIMNAEWKNAKASIGSSLLPVMQTLVGFIADKVVPAVQSFGDWFKSDGGPAIGRFGATLRDTVLPPLQAVVGWLVDNKDVMIPIAGIILTMIAAYKTWAMVSALVTAAQVALNFALTANPIGVIIMAIAGLVAGLVLAYKKVGWFRDLVDGAFQWIKTVTEAVWPVIQSVITKVWDVVKWYVTTYIGIIRNVIETVWPWIQKATEVAWAAIKMFIINPIKAAWQVVSTVLGLAREGMSIIWGHIKERASNAWQVIKDNIIDPIRRVHERLVEIVGNVREWLSGAWTTVKDRAAAAWGNIKDAILEPLRGLWGFFKTILGIGDNGISEDGPLGKLISIFSRLKERIGDAFGGIKDLLVAPIVAAFKWVNANIIGPLNEKVLSKFGSLRIDKIPIPDGYAGGGLVRGPGTGTSDSVLARLSNGEYVVNAKAAAANSELLERLNAGQPPITGSKVQSGGFNPGAWLGDLFQKGAGAAIRALTGPAMTYLRGAFGGTVGGSLALGSADTLFTSLAKWGDKQVMSTGALGQALYEYMKSIEGHSGYLHECLATIHAALDSLQDNFGFTTGSLISTSLDPNAIIRTLGRSAFNTTKAPRGALAFWQFAPNGHIAVSTGIDSESINNWGRDIIETVSNIGSNGYVGWLPPQRFVNGGTYDSGGWLKPGWNATFNGTGKPEPVLTADQWRQMMADGRRGNRFHFEIHEAQPTTEDAILTAWRRADALYGVM